MPVCPCLSLCPHICNVARTYVHVEHVIASSFGYTIVVVYICAYSYGRFRPRTDIRTVVHARAEGARALATFHAHRSDEQAARQTSSHVNVLCAALGIIPWAPSHVNGRRSSSVPHLATERASPASVKPPRAQSLKLACSALLGGRRSPARCVRVFALAPAGASGVVGW